jgi:two-component system sensor histidine kinase UhpB
MGSHRTRGLERVRRGARAQTGPLPNERRPRRFLALWRTSTGNALQLVFVTPSRPSVSLFWRVLGTNALLFVLVALALLWSPVTISYPIKPAQAAIVVVGLVAVIVADLVLLRPLFAPLEQIAQRMRGVDLLQPGQRLPASGSREVTELVTAFNEMLDRLEAERHATGRHALEAQEGERLRIAQGLHDEVGQGLTAVLLWLTSVADAVPQRRRGELTEVQDVVRRLLEEVRRIARELRPQMLDDLGLPSALSELATGFARRTGIDVEQMFDDRLPELSGQAELVIYRVAQEGLTNVARHAAASHVQLSLTKGRNSVILRLVDNGHGITPDELDGHGGLRGMRERAVFVGAAFAITRRPTGGVELRLEVPATKET